MVSWKGYKYYNPHPTDQEKSDNLSHSSVVKNGLIIRSAFLLVILLCYCPVLAVATSNSSDQLPKNNVNTMLTNNEENNPGSIDSPQTQSNQNNTSDNTIVNQNSSTSTATTNSSSTSSSKESTNIDVNGKHIEVNGEGTVNEHYSTNGSNTHVVVHSDSQNLSVNINSSSSSEGN